MGMSSGGRGGPVSDINVTPLVDVMLVLLIIFMVTAPLIAQGVQIDLPKQADPDQNPTSVDKKLVLTLTADKQIYLDPSKPIAKDRLVETLEAHPRLAKERELYLRADRTLKYGFVMDIMSKIKRAGVEQMGLVTD